MLHRSSPSRRLNITLGVAYNEFSYYVQLLRTVFTLSRLCELNPEWDSARLDENERKIVTGIVICFSDLSAKTDSRAIRTER